MELLFVKDLSLLLNGIGAGNSLLLSFLYYSKPTPLSNSNKILASLFLVLAVVILNTVINLSGYSLQLPVFELISNGLAFAIAPLLYLFVRSIQNNLEGINLWHFSGTYLYILVCTLAFVIPGSFPEFSLNLNLDHILKILWNVHFGVYLIIIFQRLHRDNTRLNGLHYLLIWGIGTIWLVNLILYVFTYLYHPLPEVFVQNTTLFFTLVALYFTYQSLSIKGLSRKMRGYQTAVEIPGSVDPMVKLILENKYYKNPDLNIRTLSNLLGLPYYQLSQTINEVYGQNFNEFINGFRVKEVIGELLDNKLDAFSVLGLAQKAGFRSGSAFYASFKKETGTTPTAYVKQHAGSLA